MEGYQRAIDWLISMDAEIKIVIAGNHDLTLDETYKAPSGDHVAQYEEAAALWKSYSDNGLYYLEEGTYSFELSNGTKFRIYASPYQPLFESATAFKYPRHHDRYNPAKTHASGAENVATERSTIPKLVDIVMTHAPASGILDKLSDGRSRGCPHLLRAIRRVKPKLHCFGHVHDSNGARMISWNSKIPEIPASSNELENISEDTYCPAVIGSSGCATRYINTIRATNTQMTTLAINASIGNIDGKPVHPAYLVTLDISSTVSV